MTFLAPWAMVLGIAGALGTVLLHLVARQRPAAYLLPTARFVPDRQTVVRRAATQPRDLVLLLLRALVLLCAGAAFARPVAAPRRAALARIVLVDRSAAVGDTAEVTRRAQVAAGAGDVPVVVIEFDSIPRRRARSTRGDRATPRAGTSGSISAGLMAALRLGDSLGRRAERVELTLVSPVTADELDPATRAIRARWPGAIALERVAARRDSTAAPALAQRLLDTDPLSPALAALPIVDAPRSVRLRRAAEATAADSAAARLGAAVVLWDSVTGPVAARGLATGDVVVVAPLGRHVMPPAGRVVARWADGAPAAVERALGAGCVRTVGVGVPRAGDVSLRAGVGAMVRALAAPCVAASPASGAAPDSALAALAGAGGPARGAALTRGDAAASPLVPWLLAAALACALLELLVRARPRTPPTRDVA